MPMRQTALPLSVSWRGVRLSCRALPSRSTSKVSGLPAAAWTFSTKPSQLRTGSPSTATSLSPVRTPAAAAALPSPIWPTKNSLGIRNFGVGHAHLHVLAVQRMAEQHEARVGPVRDGFAGNGVDAVAGDEAGRRGEVVGAADHGLVVGLADHE